MRQRKVINKMDIEDIKDSVVSFVFGMVYMIMMAIINLIPETVKAFRGKR